MVKMISKALFPINALSLQLTLQLDHKCTYQYSSILYMCNKEVQFDLMDLSFLSLLLALTIYQHQNHPN